MSLTFWRKLSVFAGWIGLLVLFGLTILIANVEIKDLDLWLHLAMGRHIVQHLQVPAVDILSFTISGEPWINHEWLFQVMVHFVNQMFGADGLINLRFVAIGLTFLMLLSIGFNNKNQLVPIALLVVVLLCYSIRMVLRPDVFSLLFFIMFIYTLASQIESRSAIITLAVLQVLWTNMHGFFIFGPALVLIMVVAEWVKRHVKLPYEWSQVGRYTNQEYKNLIIAFFVVFIACLANPYHIHGLLYPISVMTSLGAESEIFFQHITELGNPIQWNNLFEFRQYWPYRLMIVLSALSFILNRKRLDIGMFALWFIFLLLSLNALRNMIFFAVVAYLVILINLQHIKWDFLLSKDILRKKRYRHMSAIVCKVFLVMWMINYGLGLTSRGYFDYDKMERKSEFGGVTLKNYAYKAADFLVANKIQGNFFNDFNSGAYLLGRTHPDIKVAIDGRTEVYGVEYYLDIREMWKGDKERLDEFVKEHNVTGAFVNSIREPAPAKLVQGLHRDPNWIPIYFDFDALIFLRNIPENQEWIQKFGMDLTKYQTPHVDIMELGTRYIDPYQHISRAATLFNLGLYDQSGDEILTALRIFPDDLSALKILGKVAVNKQEYERAFAVLRRCAISNPQDTEARYYLALSLYQMKNYAQAEEQCLKVLESNPKNSKALALAAVIYAGQDKLDVARQIWPHEGGDLFTLDEIIAEINPDPAMLEKITGAI